MLLANAGSIKISLIKINPIEIHHMKICRCEFIACMSQILA